MARQPNVPGVCNELPADCFVDVVCCGVHRWRAVVVEENELDDLGSQVANQDGVVVAMALVCVEIPGEAMKDRLKFAAACAMALIVIMAFAGFGQYQMLKHTETVVCR